MGLYVRPDSPFYWMLLDGFVDARRRPLRESTRIHHDASTPAIRQDAKALALATYHRRMLALAREEAELPQRRETITFTACAEWFAQHKLPRRRGREREAEILPRLRAFFGSRPLAAIDRQAVDEYATRRLTTPTRRKTRRGPQRVFAGASTVNREIDLLKAILQAAGAEVSEGVAAVRHEASTRRNAEASAADGGRRTSAARGDDTRGLPVRACDHCRTAPAGLFHTWRPMMKNKSPRISRQQVVDPATLARSLVKSVDGAETTVEVELREIREVLALATVHAAGLAALAHLDCGFADGVLDDSHHAIKLLAEGAWRRLRDLSDTLPAQLGTQPSAVERGPGQTPFVMNPAAIHVGIGAKQ